MKTPQIPALKGMTPLGIKPNLRPHLTKETTPAGASAEWISTYNALQDRINGFILEGRTVPEELLNGSFNMVNTLINLQQPPHAAHPVTKATE